MSESRPGQTITLHTEAGQAFEAYESGPEDATKGVLIVHEWWGLKDHNRDLADRFGEQGFRALVVDLYDGQVTDDSEEAGQWMRDLDQFDVDAQLITALEHLQAPGRKLATYGCSFGGKQSMRATILEPESVAATVVAYCRMETDVETLNALQGPVLAIYATQESTWPQKQEAFEKAMTKAGKMTESIELDAAHGFTNPTSPHYDPAADAEAWDYTLTFLHRTLG